MYHSKKIGVFISHIFGEYQRNVCQGIIDKSLDYGYTAEIFATMDGENLGNYGMGEQSILQIPTYTEFSGVIFASETYLSTALKNQILQSLKEKCTCPIIEIAIVNPSFPAVSLENNITTGQLTEHLITEHNYQRICYLGSSTESFFSEQREHYYLAAMKKHNYSIGTHDIYKAAYQSKDITSAISFFLEVGSKPDAVVCYNDRMALLLMIHLLNAGYHIPEDIAITGCDLSDDGQSITPTLTSVSFPVYELGSTAVEQLIRSIHKESVESVVTVFAKTCICNSCGCQHSISPNSIFHGHELVERIGSLEHSILDSMRMSAAFQGVIDIDDGIELLSYYIPKIEHCKEFYLCLYSDWDSVSNHIREITSIEEKTPDVHDILLKLAVRDGKRLPECSYSKTSLLPEYIYKTSAYIFTPLFFENKEFGYIAISYEDNQVDYHFQIAHWLLNIGQMLQGICESRRTGILVNRLEDIYMKDTLTGLYNSHGYNHLAPKLLSLAAKSKSSLVCFVFDLDCLKTINDHFGHQEGDFALQVIGHALENTIQKEDICVRFSGDEFYLLSRNYTKDKAEMLLLHIEKYLTNYNKLSSKKYNISANGGFALSDTTCDYSLDYIKKLFHQADKNMYTAKHPNR